MLGAAAECRSLEAVVVRSGIEVYGRRRGAATRPDEDVPADPTTGFGRSLAADGGDRGRGRAGDRSVPVTLLRLAPVLGPHVPSPLGRYLRLPIVPVDLLGDPPFAVLHVHDAAAADRGGGPAPGAHGPVNVVADGAVTPRPGRAHGQPPARCRSPARRGGSLARPSPSWPARRSPTTSLELLRGAGWPTAVRA